MEDKELQKSLTKLKRENKVLTKEQKEENIAEWVLFYRQNLDLFNRDILGLNLKEFQNDMIREMAEGEKTDVIASRGLSKQK
ncbi:MAG: hypothetical protein KBT03_10480 [Bacteroidales bacterium]|nr:hypothetical protein [Candidatus Scybalousia scybalohippi]